MSMRITLRNMTKHIIIQLCSHRRMGISPSFRVLSTIKQSIISDLSRDIDIENLKLKRQKLIKLGEKPNIHRMMEEELENKCLHFITSMSPHQSKLLKVVQLEHSHLASKGYAVIPSERMTSKNWIEALACSSCDERLTYFLFIGHKQKKKSEQRLEETKRKLKWELEGMNEGETADGIVYGDVKRIGLTRMGNHRLASAMTLGLPLVIDMDFEGKMTSKEIGETAKQLWMAYCVNRGHPSPFHLILSGCQSNNSTYRTLELRHLLDLDHFLVTTTEKSYLDLYQPSDLVYLTPHAKQSIHKFDPNVVYILGGYSDKLSRKKMAIAKAKEQNIKCQRLPIDENVRWVQGNKDLFLNFIVKILLDAKENEKWRDAMTNALPKKFFQFH